MAGINKVIIVGNLGGEPELKSIGNNKFVCNFSVATSEEWLDKATKAKKQKTEWHNISVFGKLAEIVSSYCYKGSKVYVEGKLQTDQYEKNGETRYSTKIVVDEFRGTVQFLDKKTEGSEPKKTAKVTTPTVEVASDFDDDIPF
jgi:single-strand DNA-binding protein